MIGVWSTMRYNDTVYALLGILTTSCKTGYAIKQLIDTSLNHFWKISYGQIYPTLKLLVDEGLAEIQSVSGGKLDKKEYYLTEKGLDVLKSWLEQPMKHIPTEKNELLLKLFFGRYQSDESQLNLLEHYLHELNIRLQTYLSIEQSIQSFRSNDPDSTYWLLTLDYGKRTTKAAIEWCESTLNILAKKED